MLLLGLDDTIYGTVRSNILALDPLPTLNKVYLMLVQEERVKTISRGKEERADVMALTTPTQSNGWDSRIICSHCKQTGHDVENCFALVGYLEWWGNRPRDDGWGAGRGRWQQTPHKGGRGGRSMQLANTAHTKHTSSSTIPSTTKLDATLLLGLNATQW